MAASLTTNTALCYQCAKCSAGCPVAEEMDLLPHRVMHLAGLGLEERVLGSRTLWICAGCYACATRCPNGINVTEVMDGLRQKAREAGVPCPMPEVAAFHEAFLNDVARRGRVHEVRMMGEYNLAIRRPFKDALLGPRLFMRGRLALLPPRPLRGFKQWMRRLWRR